jgi:hypothetical protein
MINVRVESNVAQTGGGVAILNGANVVVRGKSIVRKNIAELIDDARCEEKFDVNSNLAGDVKSYKTCGCGGGGMYLAGSESQPVHRSTVVVKEDSKFLQNIARMGGGGGVKMCRDTSGTFDHVLFVGNRAGITGTRKYTDNDGNKKMSDTGGSIRAIGASVVLEETVMRDDVHYLKVSASQLYDSILAYTLVEVRNFSLFWTILFTLVIEL